MDSVSVIHAGAASTDEGGDAGYANAVKRLEDRVIAVRAHHTFGLPVHAGFADAGPCVPPLVRGGQLSRQLSVEHDARERLEDFLREKGVSVDHLQLGTTGVSSELLRTVRRTAMPQLPANAPVRDVRAALAHVEQRCLEAEEGHAASMLAVDSLMHVISTASCMDNSSEAAVMQVRDAARTSRARVAQATELWWWVVRVACRRCRCFRPFAPRELLRARCSPQEPLRLLRRQCMRTRCAWRAHDAAYYTRRARL